MHRRRKAVAMIELIVAIVVMGIVIMAAPMMIATATQTTGVALQQEGINEALSRMNMILTYPWDENATDPTCIPPILRVTHGDSELNEDGNRGRRAGTPNQTDSHTFFCHNQDFYASSILQSEGGDRDDIDDFIGISTLTTVSSGSGGTDYIESTTVHITTAVVYIDDNASYNASSIAYVPSNNAITPTTNVKRINVQLTSTSSAEELQKQITLSAFSCNVGGIEYEKRVLP